MFNVLFSSPVGSLCHTCTRGVVRRLMQTFENLLLQNCATKFLYITYQIVFEYVLSKFVQMVAPRTLLAK